MTPATVSLKPGETLFNEGDECNGVYIVRQGEIHIVRERDGAAVVLATMYPGDVIGTLTIFSKENRTATARAHTAAQVVHVNMKTIEGSFMNLPVWVEAVLKDSVARLKASNENLVQARLSERKLLNKVGNSYTYAGQISAFLGYAIRVGMIKDEGIELFPLKGVIESCEKIFQLRADALEKYFEAFAKGSLIKIQLDKKWGRSLMAPRAALMDDFSTFVSQAAKTEGTGFVPVKYHKFLSALVRIAKRPDAKPYYSMQETLELMSKDTALKIGQEVFQELVSLRVIMPGSGADKFSWTAPQLQRRLVFESTFRFVRDIQDDNVRTENKVA